MMYKHSLVAVFFATTLQSSLALALDGQIWLDSKGFQSAKNCVVKAKDDVPFRVSMHTNASGYPIENLRSKLGVRKSGLADGSIVKVISGPERKGSELVQVIGVSANDNSVIDTTPSARGNQGYLPKKALKEIDGYVFEIKGDAPTQKIGSTNIALAGTYWQTAIDKDHFQVYQCGDSEKTEFVIFDVFVKESQTPVARVGVQIENTAILRSIRTRTSDDAEVAINNPQPQAEPVKTSIMNSVSGLLMPLVSKISSSIPEDEEEALGANPTPISEDKDNSSGATQAPAANGAAAAVTPGSVEIINGALEYVVCTKGDVDLSVRDESLENVKFIVPKFEEVLPMQSFGESTKTKDFDGVTTTYIQASFPDREGEDKTGWVAEKYIKPRSQCPGADQSTVPNQADIDDTKEKEQGSKIIICTGITSPNVRGDNLDEILFQANPLEEVKLTTDWEKSGKTKKVGSTSYLFVPVTFPGRENKQGWVAKEFVQPEASCPHAQADEDGEDGGSSADIGSGSDSAAGTGIAGLSDANCCNFPTIERPTHSYKDGMRRFRALRSKGKRLHAACDLYRKKNEKAVAIADGKVIRDKYFFYQGTYAVEVRHTGGFVARYGEVTGKTASGIEANRKVKSGQTIGFIGKVNSNCCLPMLHFELYSGAKKGGLNSKVNKFQRRSDLLDPTKYLEKWEKKKFGESY